MLICDANARHFLDYIYQVVGNNVVQYELSLIPEVNRIEILRGGSQKVTRACSSFRFETVILHGHEPGESEEVGNDNIWTHHLEHAFLGLEIVHEY